MSEASRGAERRWILCEAGDRWRQSVWRFVPDWLAEEEQLAVRYVAASDIAAEIERLRVGVVLWEIAAGRVAEIARAMAVLDADRTGWLQIAAVDRLSRRDRCALSQFGVVALIRHPEDLAGLQQMVRGHFARAARLLH